MKEWLTRASAAVEAAHAVVGGVHSTVGCHACTLWLDFQIYVRNQVHRDHARKAARTAPPKDPPAP